MKAAYFKDLSWFVAGMFLLASHICVLEQPLMKFSEFIQHTHQHISAHEHNGASHSDHHGGHHDSSNQHEHHDHEAAFDFCCDTILSPVANYTQFTIYKTFEYFDPAIVLPATQISFQNHLNNIDISGSPEPVSFRNRDNYALSCLLHAPPQV